MEHQEVGTAAAKVTAVNGLAAFYSYTLQEWVWIFAIIFTLFQIIVIMPRLVDTVCGFVSFIKRIFGKKNEPK